MKKLIIKYWILIAILLLAAFLRFYRLDTLPALNADEAAIGYNAYSLIQTGMDEHGNAWPIHFQSFNDYKPGLFFYLVLPFIKFMGLTELAVRIPGALFGVGTILAIYLLAKELFKKSKEVNGKLVATIAALMLAISPWHIHFSRGGWEVNVATFFITLGFWLFLKARQNPKYYVLAVLSLVVSLYTYHAARIIVPLIGLGTVIIYWKDIKNSLKQAVVAGIIGIVLLIPLTKDLIKPEISSRAVGVGIFSDPGPLNRINEQRGEHGDLASPLAKITHNKPVNFGLAFLSNWGEHYWGEFLFLSGDDIQRNRVPETGQMYLYDLPLIIIGIYILIKKFGRSSKFILLWVIVAPVAAALTFQSPHALRSHNMVIPLVIISAVGLSGLLDWLRKEIKVKTVLYVGYLLILVAISWQFARYQHQYWVHMVKEYPFSSQYGVKELVDYIQAEAQKYENIIITDRYDQPYILTLFYSKYSPREFQKDHELTGRDIYGFSTVRSFSRYRFHSIKFDEERPASPNALIIGTDEEIPDHANVIKNIYGVNGHLYFQIVAN